MSHYCFLQMEQFCAKGLVYDNAIMLSTGGDVLCHTDRKRLEWYCKKGLAVLVAEEPFTVRLTFEHKTGDQERGAEGFYTAAKCNVCVACGVESHYLRYRVVPNCYRRALPVRMKSHRSHDVVLLCWSCHETASQSSERLKGQVAAEYGVPLLPPLPSAPAPGPGGGDEDGAAPSSSGGGGGQAGAALHPCNVRRSAMALQRYGGEMPYRRRRYVLLGEWGGPSWSAPCELSMPHGVAATSTQGESLPLPGAGNWRS